MEWILADRSLIRLTGNDVDTFLQGIITANTKDATQGKALLSALLSPQGKLMHDFFLLRDGDALYVDVAAEQAQALIKKFKIYKMRADVVLTPLGDEYSVAFSDAPVQGAVLSAADDRLSGGYIRNIVLKSQQDDSEAYHAWRIEQGLPEAAQDTTERTFLLDLGYDAMGAVDFEKGCYVGQEVTARMHYKNARKRLPYRVLASKDVVAGDITTAQGVKIGEIRSCIGKHAIAVCQWQAVEQAKQSSYTVGDQEVSLRVPEWFASAYEKITTAAKQAL